MSDWYIVLLAIGKCALALGIGFLLHVSVNRVCRTLANRGDWPLGEALLSAFRRPSRLLFPLLALAFALPTITELPAGSLSLIRHAISIGFIAVVSWLLVALIDAGAKLIMRQHDVSRADNLSARRVHTQTLVLERTAILIVVLLGSAAALMTFPSIRQIGASLLVSAGVAGLAIGLAARPVLENIFAGLQLALTQPIRVDDVVIVEGEWGRIEEITTTYVVVRIWDERRLIVPLSYFISRPFQNWTRQTADILGSVFIYADYTAPVPAIRAELERLCSANRLWDGRVCNLQVTDATEHTIQLRALVSAADSSSAWDLRVQLREQLIAFLQREHPECLPRARLAHLQESGGGLDASGAP